MLSRLLRPASRQLIISSVYAGVFVCGLANLAVNATTFHTIELGLTIAGVAVWGAATVHGMVRRITVCCNDRPEEDKDSDQLEGNERNAELSLCNRQSTHAALNGALHVGASSVFAMNDILTLSRVIPVTPASLTNAQLAVRLSGTGLWFFTANLNMVTALAIDRKKESHPKQDFKMCGVSGEVYNFVGEVTYISAGVLYAYVIYTYLPLNPIKATGNGLWLLAGLLGNTAALYELISKHCVVKKEENSIELSRISEESEASSNLTAMLTTMCQKK